MNEILIMFLLGFIFGLPFGVVLYGIIVDAHTDKRKKIVKKLVCGRCGHGDLLWFNTAPHTFCEKCDDFVIAKAKNEEKSI